MTERLNVLKTYKLYIDGKFPRSESGRSHVVSDSRGRVLAHVAKASRKDLRDAVEAARKAQPGWANATAYNRGQVLYRMAEMMEGKRDELEAAIAAIGESGSRAAAKSKTKSAVAGPRREVAAAVDRLVAFAGWADKYSQVLGCNNPVSGPYYNFTVPEPTGIVAVLAPDECPLLALVSLIVPAICSGNAVVALASGANPIPGAILGEIGATSDVPAGVINILTGDCAELISHITTHRDIDAIHAAGGSAEQTKMVREGVAENLKRVVVRGTNTSKSGNRPAQPTIDWFDAEACHSPWWIEPFVEMKTIWHPAAV
jgi:acyl-CoA reductase-like NAD-dependent aldehyde dehydrogenase